jgi:hypothetical protein
MPKDTYLPGLFLECIVGGLHGSGTLAVVLGFGDIARFNGEERKQKRA